MTITSPHFAIINKFVKELDELISELDSLQTNADCLEVHAMSVKDEFHSVIDELEIFSGTIDTIIDEARTSMENAHTHALE